MLELLNRYEIILKDGNKFQGKIISAAWCGTTIFGANEFVFEMLANFEIIKFRSTEVECFEKLDEEDEC